jgi:hypothetical protein
LTGVALQPETVCDACVPEHSAALPSCFSKFREERWALKADSARKPEIPLCPLAEAKSAGVLLVGYLGVGSVNAPGAAPRWMRDATVRSLIFEPKYKKSVQI